MENEKLDSTFSKLECPFCHRPFELPSAETLIGEDVESSCGCGAVFCLIIRGDEWEDRLVLHDKYGADFDVRIVKKVDSLTDEVDSPPGPSDIILDALFWIPPNTK